MTYIDWDDLLAIIFFVICTAGYAHYSEHGRNHNSSLLATTNRYRTQWMREILKRETRTMDAIMVGNLQRSITFFANTSIFILIGLVSMLGYYDRTSAIIDHIPYAKPTNAFLWEIKLFLLIIIFIYAFFKYTWSLRQYNYAGIFIAAAPAPNDRVEDHEKIIEKGSYLVGNAAKHFNNGLRAYYYGLAALSWFIHPYLFMFSTAWVVFVTHRQEFRSNTLRNIAR